MYHEAGFSGVLGCTLAAALALTGCGRAALRQQRSRVHERQWVRCHERRHSRQEQAWRTGLGVVTEAAGSDRAGKITTAAAAVVLDADGKLADVMLDELELSVSGGSTGSVTTPEDVRSKRTKGRTTRWRRRPPSAKGGPSRPTGLPTI